MKLEKLYNELVNEAEDLSGKTFTSTQTDFDPETRSVTWKIEYKPDFAKLLTSLIEAEKAAYGILRDKEISKDTWLKDLAAELKFLKNAYRDHLRNSYPGEYQQVKQKVRQS